MAKRKQHRALKDRKVRELQIVVRLDRYCAFPNTLGGFTAISEYPPNRGMLWPDAKAATKAARYIMRKYPDSRAVFGIFKLHTIVEEQDKENLPPVTITKV